MAQHLEQSKDREGLRPLRLSTWRGRTTALIGVGAVAVGLVACSSSTTPRTSSPTSTSSTSSPTRTGSKPPTDLPPPIQWLMEASDLAAGWRDNSIPRRGDVLRFRDTTFCGVALEPVLPGRAGDRRFVETSVGPYFEQDVRVYRDDHQAEAVVSALRAALPTCTLTQVSKGGSDPQRVTLKVEPLSVAGAGPDSAAWRETDTSESPVTAEVLFARRGRTLVVFVSYGLGRQTINRNVMVRAVAVLQTKPKS